MNCRNLKPFEPNIGSLEVWSNGQYFLFFFLISSRTMVPDTVKSSGDHPPRVLAPGFKAADSSSLSAMDQFKCDMPCSSKNSHHNRDSGPSMNPSPLA